MVAKDTTSVPKGLVPRYSEALCVTLVFCDTCRAEGANNNLFIIQFLPIYLVEFARAWLDHLLRNAINSWDDLREVFTSNFQGTYVRPGNPWDLKDYWQKSGKLPSVVDANIISAFWDGSTCLSLVHEPSREQPKTTKALLDIVTQHTLGEEAVGAAFTLVNKGAAAGSGRMAPTSTTVKSTQKGAKGRKTGQKRHPRRLALVTNNCNEEVEDSDEECVAIAEHDFKLCTKPPKDHFEKIHEAACPHHPYPVKHKLRDCTMMKKFMSSGGHPLAATSWQETQEVGARWKSQSSPADYDPKPGMLCG
jgi:hypothetical protein